MRPKVLVTSLARRAALSHNALQGASLNRDHDGGGRCTRSDLTAGKRCQSFNGEGENVVFPRRQSVRLGCSHYDEMSSRRRRGFNGAGLVCLRSGEGCAWRSAPAPSRKTSRQTRRVHQSPAYFRIVRCVFRCRSLG